MTLLQQMGVTCQKADVLLWSRQTPCSLVWSIDEAIGARGEGAGEGMG